jgi:hypothetical protein
MRNLPTLLHNEFDWVSLFASTNYHRYERWESVAASGLARVRKPLNFRLNYGHDWEGVTKCPQKLQQALGSSCDGSTVCLQVLQHLMD